ncbi:MAG: hydrogenase maturation protease [Candidatus Omnitrophota bacterium]
MYTKEVKTNTLILGIGNTIRLDDRVGIEVVRRLAEKITLEDTHIKESSEAGFNLLDLILGYQKLIIVDSIQTKDGKSGDIYRLTKSDFTFSLDPCFSHNSGLARVFAWAERAKLPVPKDIIFYAIEIKKCDIFGEGLTREVEMAIPELIKLIEEEIVSVGKV